MIRTSEEYRDSIRDNREVFMNGERVKDVTAHPMFKPLVDIRARMYDMAHDPATCDVMTVTQGSEVNAIGSSLPYTQDDWWAKRRATDLLMEDIGGVVTRVGDETVGEMWSLFDGTDVLNEVDPQFAKNIETHIGKVLKGDPFQVSANTDPKGDRFLAPQDQDPDMLLHVVKETDAGIVVRGQNMKLLLPMPIKPSPNRPSPIGAMLSCRTMRSGSSLISVHWASSFCIVAALLGRMGGAQGRIPATIPWPIGLMRSIPS